MHCNPHETWWGLVQWRNLDYVIAGPRAGSSSVVLAAQCPVKGEVKGLGCVSSFLWCFAYFSNMISRAYGIFNSSCRVKLDTYRGALVVMRRIFDCAFCSIAWLDLLAQISMPYVQIGFIIVLYIKSLFSIDSRDFLPSSQYNSFTLSSILIKLIN